MQLKFDAPKIRKNAIIFFSSYLAIFKENQFVVATKQKPKKDLDKKCGSICLER